MANMVNTTDTVSTRVITGTLFIDMLRCASLNLKNNVRTVNELNVFPIPDGDTGDNMSRTFDGGVIAALEGGGDLSGITEKMAEGMLLSARGNSGVILSQFFEGFRRSCAGVRDADVSTLCKAFGSGVRQAYSAVVKPTEGTMLTVMREATDYAVRKTGENGTIEQFFDAFTQEMYASLDRTPMLLPVLQEAGVIDSGGAGFVYIIEGMNRALRGEKVVTETLNALDSFEQPQKAAEIAFDRDSKMQFGYCTELILQLTDEKTDVDSFNVDKLIAYLESVGGESIVAFRSGTRVKLHVHTFRPDKVFAYCLDYGELVSVKVENMAVQHSGSTVANSFKGREPIKREKKPFAIVTVADGEGLTQTLRQLGADCVVGGGQTMNPSAQDFIAAFDEAYADCIFVLPNNSNIILTAKQAGELYEGAKIRVIESRTVAEGYAALTMLDYSSGDADSIAQELENAIAGVTTASVTYAVRDAHTDGFEVKKGDWLGFNGKKVAAVSENRLETVKKLLQSLDMSEKDVIIAITGKDVTPEERAALGEFAGKAFPLMEYYEVEGGQDVYSYIFAVE